MDRYELILALSLIGAVVILGLAAMLGEYI